MQLTALLHERLVATQHWLLANGPELLGLDPTCERLVMSKDRAMGVDLCLGKSERVRIAGAPLRPQATTYPPASQVFDFVISDIIHDGPGDAVDNALHRLAISRTQRRMGKDAPSLEYIRVPDVLLTFLRVQGVQDNDRHGAISRSVDAGPPALIRRAITDSGDEAVIVERELNGSNRIAMPGFYFFRSRHEVEAINLRLPDDTCTHLDVRRSPGQFGHRYGRFYLTGKLPDMIISQVIGRPFAGLISHPLTDPYDLRIVHHDFRYETTTIGFEGADQMQAKTTLFLDADAKALFDQEYAELAPARDRLMAVMSLDALPDEWWRRFKGHIGGREASYFSPGNRSGLKRGWLPKDSFNRFPR